MSLISCADGVRLTSVVVVDDSDSSRDQLAGMVSRLPGCRPVPFADPAEALEYCADNEPDLILVDYHMPHPDGLVFIEQLRRVEAKADVPVIMVTGCSDRLVRHRALQLGATDFLTKPVDEFELIARIRNLLRLRAIHTTRAQWLSAEVRKATEALRESEREAIFCLSRAAEHRDPETASHLVRMADYARLIAEALDLPAAQVDLIHGAAPMHDVGKIGIPDAILLKPGKLTADEVAVMQQHTWFGFEILGSSTSPLMRVAAEIALCHHERFDGGGYPRGLKGEDIPLMGRITALADVFDALTSVRPYKTAWPIDKALDYVTGNRGTHFDADCVDAFMERLPDVQVVHLQG